MAGGEILGEDEVVSLSSVDTNSIGQVDTDLFPEILRISLILGITRTRNHPKPLGLHVGVRTSADGPRRRCCLNRQRQRPQQWHQEQTDCTTGAHRVTRQVIQP